MSIESRSVVDAPGLASAVLHDPIEHPGHCVQFYEDDGFLLDAVSRFIGAGLRAGDGGVVIATTRHLDGLAARLSACGLDVAAARDRGQYVAVDAAETLSDFMDGGSPEPARFAEVVGSLLAGAARDGGRPVRAFGEMVALLWAEGNPGAAIGLEDLWNELGRIRPLSLLCAYPMHGFDRAEHEQAFREICSRHSRVIPAESYAAAPTPTDGLRLVARLQQKAAALEAEIAERKEIEQVLRLRERERAELLAREQAARADAEAASRSKDEFLATLSHELRTPMAAMLGWVRLLRTGRLDAAKTTHALEVVERNTQAQARLIEDILDVSRIITGKLQLDLRQVEPAAVIRAALEAVRPAAEAKGVCLQSALDPSVGPVAGDPDRLQQAVWNLLSNGVKYTPSGGHVEVRLDRVGSTTRITVRDTGIGIRSEFLPHVFERFTQAGRGPARSESGLGLGLAIVRHLVELHGGTVHAESPGEGQGATFTLNLPAPVAAMERRHLPPATPGSRMECAPRTRLDGIRVLVVDDDGDVRELLTTIFEQCGAQVHTVASVRAAVEALERVGADVLVSDIGLPGESGYDLIRAVRGLGSARSGIPAIALSAYARAEDREQALAAGYQLHLSKPIEPDRLGEAVAQVLRRASAAQPAPRA
jgi:signal transduction histidine kinase/ActR/RegA family two-component response regulator